MAKILPFNEGKNDRVSTEIDEYDRHIDAYDEEHLFFDDGIEAAVLTKDSQEDKKLYEELAQELQASY